MEVVVDQFKIVSVDEDGKIYDKVSRARLESSSMKAVLDYHSILLPLEEGGILSIVIYKGEVDDEDVPKEYGYLMFGKCYRHIEERNLNVYYISFGGLLLNIEAGSPIGLSDFDDVGFACKRI